MTKENEMYVIKSQKNEAGTSIFQRVSDCYIDKSTLYKVSCHSDFKFYTLRAIIERSWFLEYAHTRFDKHQLPKLTKVLDKSQNEDLVKKLSNITFIFNKKTNHKFNDSLSGLDIYSFRGQRNFQE